jgi:hypothetical protein
MTPVICSNCNNTMDRPLYRFILQAKLADSTGSLWVTISDNAASKLVGIVFF